MRGSLLSSAIVLSLFAVSTFAQETAELPKLSSATPSNSASRTTGGNTKSNTASVTDETTRRPAATVAITGAGESDTATGAVPTITGGADATDGGELPSGLPTLSGAFRVVPASVPPIAGAPYMQQSSLPEGTVFIAVGAILGFFAMSVLLWRGLVAWSLHRSVKRASQHQTMSDTKAMFGQTKAPIYNNYKDRDSTIDLSTGGGKAGRKANRPSTAPGAVAAASLFFSPTAGAVHNAGNRGSNYLPAGYYAAGSSAPGNNQSHVTVGGQGPSISLSNLAHQSQGYSRARSMAPSPPESPVVSGDPGYTMQSSSTLNLKRGYGGEERAPSAYLDDMFDSTEGAPSHAPLQHPAHRSSQHGRF